MERLAQAGSSALSWQWVTQAAPLTRSAFPSLMPFQALSTRGCPGLGKAPLADNSDFPPTLPTPSLNPRQLSDGNLESQLNAALVRLASLQLH